MEEKEKRKFEPIIGMFSDMPGEEVGLISGLSATRLKDLEPSAYNYRWKKDHPKLPSPTMFLGSAFDMALLQPELFERKFRIFDFKPTASGAYTEARIGECAESGQRPLAVEHLEVVREMVHVVKSKGYEWLEPDNGTAQVTVLWQDPAHGFQCKAVIDWLTNDGLDVEVKTCRDASEEGFWRQVGEMRYHWQVAWQLLGLQTVSGYPSSWSQAAFLAVQTTEPIDCSVYPMLGEDLQAAYEQLIGIRRRYADALSSGKWPGLPAYGAGELKPWHRRITI